MNPVLQQSITVNHRLLIRPAETLLLISFSWAMLQAIREREPLDGPVIRLVVAILLLQTYEQLFAGLKQLSFGLNTYLEQLGSKTALLDFVSQAMTRAAAQHQAPAGAGVGAQVFAGAGNIAEYLSQGLRLGVWGICASIVEFVFLLVRYLLTLGADVLWELAFVFMPPMIALLPQTPRLVTALGLGALEICLWQPVLTVLDVVTSVIARSRSLQTGDVGFSVLAIEALAVLLALTVIPLCHKIISGSVGNVDALRHLRDSTVRPIKSAVLK